MPVQYYPTSQSQFKRVKIVVDAISTGITVSGSAQYKENIYNIESIFLPISYPGEPTSYRLFLGSDGVLHLSELRTVEGFYNPSDMVFLLLEFTLASDADTPETVPVLVSDVELVPNAAYEIGNTVISTVNTFVKFDVSDDIVMERNKRSQRAALHASLKGKDPKTLSLDDLRRAVSLLLNT